MEGFFICWTVAVVAGVCGTIVGVPLFTTWGAHHPLALILLVIEFLTHCRHNSEYRGSTSDLQMKSLRRFVPR